MSIRDKARKINTPAVLVAIIIVLVGFASFGIGRLSSKESFKPEIKYYPENFITTNDGDFVKEGLAEKATDSLLGVGDSNDTKTSSGEKTLYVGSKNSDKYHFPWCSGALRMKDENKVWFSSVEEAEAAGYTPAGNCPGL